MSARSEPSLLDRVVRIRVPVGEGNYASGSGLVVVPERVLTARHVLTADASHARPGARCEVRVWSESQDAEWVPGTVEWVADDRDVAVLAVPGLLPDAVDVAWGELTGVDPVEWTATGYPLAGKQDTGRKSETAHGTVARGSGSASELGMTVTSRRPQERGGGSGWRGLSGAAICAGGCVIGVVVSDPEAWEQSLIGLRLSSFLTDPGLLAALRRPPPELISVPRGGTGSQERASRPPVRYVNTAPPRLHEIVGREAQLQALLAELRSASGLQRVAVTVAPGIGKTELARALAHDPRLSEVAPNGVLWADLGAHPDCMTILSDWAQALGADVSQLVERSTIQDRKQLVRRLVGQDRLLVVLDDVHDADVVKQLLDLAPGGCSYLATTRRTEVARALAPGKVEELKALDPEASLALFYAIADNARRPELDGAVRRLVALSAGMPLAVVLLASRIAIACGGGDVERCLTVASELEDRVERLGNDKDRHSLRKFIRGASGSLSKQAQAGLLALSALRPYPGWWMTTTATAITGVPKKVIWELGDAGFLLRDEGRYSMPTPFADYGRVKLGEKRAAALNRAALDHYSAARRDLEQTFSDPSSYLRRYRYEHDGWQRLRAEWLYHLAQVESPPEAESALAHTYFEAHYWWGHYVPYPFCEELLELDVLADSPVMRLLRTFDQLWPRRGSTGGRAAWAAAADALEECRRHLGVSLDTPDVFADAPYLRLVTDLLLAKALGEVDPFDPRIDALYAEAQPRAQASEHDAWMLGWIDLRKAEIRAKRDEPQAACELSTAASVRARQEQDEELLASSHRLLAQLSAPDAAVEHWTTAVLAAYRAQGLPSEPDFYNQSFLEDVITDYERWLQHTATTNGAAVAADAALRLRAAFPPELLAAGGGSGPPDVPELLQLGSADRLRDALVPPFPRARPDESYLERLAQFLSGTGRQPTAG